MPPITINNSSKFNNSTSFQANAKVSTGSRKLINNFHAGLEKSGIPELSESFLYSVEDNIGFGKFSSQNVIKFFIDKVEDATNTVKDGVLRFTVDKNNVKPINVSLHTTNERKNFTYIRSLLNIDAEDILPSSASETARKISSSMNRN